MKQNDQVSGHFKEYEVYTSLLALGARAKLTDNFVDRFKKDDMTVSGLIHDGQHCEARVQVTCAIDNIEKLAQWLERRENFQAINLYVQMHKVVSPKQIAMHIFETLKKCNPGSYVLVIDKHGGKRITPPPTRLAEMKIQFAQRVKSGCEYQGKIVEIKNMSLLIESTGNGIFWAYNHDIKDGRLYGLVRLMQTTGRGVSVPPVKFTALKHGRPYRRAINVVIDSKV